MNTSITNQLEISRTPEYDKAFWNAMRIKNYTPSHLTGDINSNTDAYFLPTSDRKAFADKFKEESLPRRIGSILNVYDKGRGIFAKDTADMAKWVPELGSIPIYEGILDFKESALDSHKLASFVKFDNSFVQDNAFFFSNYLMQRFARVIGKGEEQDLLQAPAVICHTESFTLSRVRK